MPEVKKVNVSYKKLDLSIATKFRQTGSNTTLIFLHGIGCAKECFDEAFNVEGLGTYSILTFDFVGFGESDKPDDFTYTMEDYAAIARLLIERLGLQRVALVAHSMGGTIGVLVAKELDNLVGFINAEGNLVSEDAGIVSRETAEQSEEGFLHEGYEKFLASLQSSTNNSMKTWAGWYKNSSPIAIYRSGSSLVEWSDNSKLLEYFNELPKAAYIYGEHTPSEHVLPKLKDVNTYRISNSGHFMMLDNPQDFYEVIVKELGSTPPA